VAAKKSLFRNNKFTKAGTELNKKASEFLENIYDEYTERGYKIEEIDSLLMFALVYASSFTSLRKISNE